MCVVAEMIQRNSPPPITVHVTSPSRTPAATQWTFPPSDELMTSLGRNVLYCSQGNTSGKGISVSDEQTGDVLRDLRFLRR
jgi:hypothetical protein